MQYHQLQPHKIHVNRHLTLPWRRFQSGHRSRLHPWRPMMMTDADPDLIYLPMPNTDNERTNWWRTMTTITSNRLRYHGPFRHWQDLWTLGPHVWLLRMLPDTLELPVRSGRTNSLHSHWLTAPNVNTWLVESIMPLRVERSCWQCSSTRKVPKTRLPWQPGNYFRLIFPQPKYYT